MRILDRIGQHYTIRDCAEQAFTHYLERLILVYQLHALEMMVYIFIIRFPFNFNRHTPFPNWKIAVFEFFVSLFRARSKQRLMNRSELAFKAGERSDSFLICFRA